MKKINLGEATTIVANLGVIAGIVFLAVELQQNNELLQSDAEYRVMQNHMLFDTELIDDVELMIAFNKAGSGEDLNEIERYRLAFLYRRLWLSLAWEWQQAERGLTPPLSVEVLGSIIDQDAVASESWQAIQPAFERLNPKFYEFLAENDLLR